MQLHLFLMIFLAIPLSLTAVSINFGLLFAIFISKKLKKCGNLELFYLRFFIDMMVGIGCSIQSILYAIQFSHIRSFLDSHPNFIFYAFWPTANFANVRTFLVMIIALDRFFAVFVPISYFNLRKKIPNVVIFLVPSSYAFVDNFVLWIVCKHEVNLPPNCSTIECLGLKCFAQYAMIYEIVAHLLIAISSLLLAIRLFVWNRKERSKNLERANYLALIDTLVILMFDVVPAIVITSIPNMMNDFSSLLTISKMAGFVFEGCLVIQALKRKNEITDGQKSSVLTSK
ncbi:hypothetical protein CAEBREN_07900 [Caenorhabditis brenneri]|uniref:Serpentine Receptor, class BC (Class B-like) n=1 Tax=Caenorhabditis brenneri TaxID=135651 RepID=G0NEH5_CAEBE|nr:hypothetical protein CAEBREN_07900 [Caenorhabditis brenneri]